MPTVRTTGASIRYVESGTGPPLVLLPGLGCPLDIWDPQIAHFAADHRVVAIDPRGVGRSSRLDGWRRILSRQAADVAGVLDELGIDRAVVCGVSYGGVLAQRFAIDFPRRVAGLVTVDSFCDTRPRTIPEAVNLAALYATGWMWLVPGLLRPGIRRQYARWPDAQRYMMTVLDHMRRWETVKIRYALNRVSLARELGALRCPTLGIVADSRWLIPLSQRIVGAIPAARLAVIPDSFDPSNRCRPEAFNRVLGQFLRDGGRGLG